MKGYYIAAIVGAAFLIAAFVFLQSSLLILSAVFFIAAGVHAYSDRKQRLKERGEKGSSYTL